MAERNRLVLTDSACDLPPQMAAEAGVEIMSFEITVDGKSYTERVDFTFDEYYDMLRACEKVPSTAHITWTRFLERFEKADDDGVEELLYVSINRSGSATHDAAVMAEEKFRTKRPSSTLAIHLVDSRTYSMGYGWFVAEAARKLRGGESMEDVTAWLNDRFSRVDIILAAYTLNFMKKSGRISAAAAFAGELLGLRPVISLTDGVSTVRQKIRGDKDVMPTMVKYVQENRDPNDMWYAIVTSNDDTCEELAALCTQQWGVPPVGKYKLGAAVATNTGPDAVAIVFIGGKRP